MIYKLAGDETNLGTEHFPENLLQYAYRESLSVMQFETVTIADNRRQLYHARHTRSSRSNREPFEGRRYP